MANSTSRASCAAGIEDSPVAIKRSSSMRTMRLPFRNSSPSASPPPACHRARALATFVIGTTRRPAYGRLSELGSSDLYAVGLGRAVIPGDIALLASAEQPWGADDAADAAILGARRADAAILGEPVPGRRRRPISAMRTLHFRLLRVSDALASGATFRSAVSRRSTTGVAGVFSRAAESGLAPAVHRAFARLYEAEKTCKQAEPLGGDSPPAHPPHRPTPGMTG